MIQVKMSRKLYLRERSNNFDGDHALREKSPNTEFFLVHIFPYSVQMRESTDGKKFRIWTFSRSAWGLIIESRLFIRSELFLMQNFSFWKSYGRQRVNSKRCILKIEIICDFYEKRPDFHYELAISKIIKHFSPSALTFWQPQDTGVSDGG